MTKLSKRLAALASEFDLREVRVQTEDRREYFIRFEDGKCVGCWDSTMPEDEKAKLEMMQVKAIIDRHADMGWLASYGHDLVEGFVYSYWDGRYEAKRELEMEDAA